MYPGTKLYALGKKTKFINDEYWLSKNAAPVYTAEKNIMQLRSWEDKIWFSYYLQTKKLFRLGQTIVYRKLFLNFKEMIKMLGPKFDVLMEKVDHILHRG